MARRKYRKWWKQTGNVLVDHIVCPKCGENSSEHTITNQRSRLFCQCKDGDCFNYDGSDLVWKRSPCPNAKCEKCGWSGTMSSTEFQQVYNKSRCPLSDNGWHDVTVKVYKNETPEPLTIELRCKMCGAVGHKTIDAVAGIAWSEPEQGGKDEGS